MKIFRKNIHNVLTFLYICTDSGSLEGLVGRILVEKGRLRTLSSVTESRKFKCQEDIATEASTLRVLYTAYSYMGFVNISRRGLSSCLSLARQCESPVTG